MKTLKELTYVKSEMFSIERDLAKYVLLAPDGTPVAAADNVYELSRYAFDECGAQAVAHHYVPTT